MAEKPRNLTRVKPKGCAMCGEIFTPRDKAQKALVCSDECRELRKKELSKKSTKKGAGTGLNPDGSVKSKFLVRGAISTDGGTISGTGSVTI